MGWTVTQTNNGNTLALEGAFEALDGASVSYGWTEESADYPDGTDIITVAASNHFGTDRIPARPILTTSFERQADELAVLAETLNDEIISGRVNDITSTLTVIGQFAQSTLQRDFTRASQDFAPLADSTIASKGHDTPLIDTGHLRSQVKFTVET